MLWLSIVVSGFKSAGSLASLAVQSQTETACTGPTKWISSFLTGSPSFSHAFDQKILFNAKSTLRQLLDDLLEDVPRVKANKDLGVLYGFRIHEKSLKTAKKPETLKESIKSNETNISHEFVVTVTQGNDGYAEFQTYAAFANNYTALEFLGEKKPESNYFEPRRYNKFITYRTKPCLNECIYRKSLNVNGLISLLLDLEQIIMTATWNDKVNTSYKRLTGVDMIKKPPTFTKIDFFYSKVDFDASEAGLEESFTKIQESKSEFEQSYLAELKELEKMSDNAIFALPEN